MLIQTPRAVDNCDDWEELKRFTALTLKDIVNLINGNINLTENCQARLVEVVCGVPNIDVRVNHNLGVVPSGYLVSGRTANMVIYDGQGKASATDIFIRASAAGTVKILVFG